MSTDHHNTGHDGVEPTHADVSFEERDVQPGSIYGYLIALAVSVILSYVVAWYVLRITTTIAVQSDPQVPSVVHDMGLNYAELPPEPRLQGVPGHENDAQYDLRTKIKQDTAANEQYGWVDEKSGIAQIPVKDAMKIIAEKGMPGAPAAEQK